MPDGPYARLARIAIKKMPKWPCLYLCILVMLDVVNNMK